MGQSKTGGYTKQTTVTSGQKNLLNQLMAMAGTNQQQAAQGYQQFLPGGGGGQAITNAANQNFQQNTIPSIMNQFGVGAKSSSALNQALAAGAANLNTGLASQLSQLQLSAAGGLGGLGTSQAQLGAGTPQFAYTQNQQPFWQSALLGTLGVGGQLGAAALGRPSYNFGTQS